MSEHDRGANYTEADAMRVEAELAAAIAKGIEDGTMTFSVGPDGTAVTTSELTGRRIVERPDGSVTSMRFRRGEASGFSFYFKESLTPPEET